MGDEATNITAALASSSDQAGGDAQQRVYKLAAGGDGTNPNSVAALNGKALQLVDGGLPPFVPLIQRAGTPVTVAPLGIALIDLDARAPACM